MIGRWHAALARRLHRITVTEVKRKWKCNKDYAIMLHRSYLYVFGPRGSETSLEHQKKKHLYTKGGDAYAAGKLASMMWPEEPDNKMLQASEQVVAFRYNLGQLTDPNPRTRATFSDALGMLTSDPIKIRLPTKCFRTGI